MKDEEAYGKADPNGMDGVDFSGAMLRGVMFVNGIDLSRVIVPTDGNHVLVRNVEDSIARCSDIVQTQWPKPERSVALAVLTFLRRPDQSGRCDGIINVLDISSYVRTHRVLASREQGVWRRSGATESKQRTEWDMELGRRIAFLLRDCSAEYGERAE